MWNEIYYVGHHNLQELGRVEKDDRAKGENIKGWVNLFILCKIYFPWINVRWLL